MYDNEKVLKASDQRISHRQEAAVSLLTAFSYPPVGKYGSGGNTGSYLMVRNWMDLRVVHGAANSDRPS